MPWNSINTSNKLLWGNTKLIFYKWPFTYLKGTSNVYIIHWYSHIQPTKETCSHEGLNPLHWSVTSDRHTIFRDQNSAYQSVSTIWHKGISPISGGSNNIFCLKTSFILEDTVLFEMLPYTNAEKVFETSIK